MSDKCYWAVFGGMFAIAIFFMLLAFSLPIPKSGAMKVCELSHSHDVCFQALNR